MSLVHDIQSSFAGGEIAPDLQGRVDLAKYKVSAKTLRNMIPGPRGAASNRPGTYFVAGAKSNSTRCRLISFVPSASAAYALEFGEGYIRFYRNGGQILSGGVAYEVTTPYLASDLADLRFARSADTLYIVHPSYAPRTLQRLSDNSWTLALYAFRNGPFMLGNADTTKIMSRSSDGGGPFISSNFDLFQPTHAGGLFQVTQFIDASVLSGSRTSVGAFSYTTEVPSGYLGTGDVITSLSCGGGWRFRTHGTWAGKIVLQKSYDNGSTWQNIQYFISNSDVNFDTFGTEDISLNDGNPFLIRAYLLSYTSGTPSVDLTASAFEVYTTVQTTTYSTARKMYIAAGSITFLSTSVWAEGSWSDYRGWPSAVNFFQDRLVFASTTAEPQGAWFTKTSNYVDFGRSIPLVDSDGITVNLQSRQVNPIVNIVSASNTCLFFSSFSYWSVGSTSGGSITPSTVTQKLQENRGVNAVDPVSIGNRLIFIESRGTTVRDIEYQFLSDRYQSENISLSADHLFRTYSIVDMAYQQVPDSVLWLIRSDGVLLSCTYLREQEVLAWSWHDTAGTFESVCVIPGSGVDEVWFVVKRGSSRFIERMLLRTTSTDPADQYFVDCGIAYSGSATSSLSGYSHLDGFTVALQANGFVKPQQVVSGGLVSVPAGTTKASVGLPYVCDLETLNPEIPLQDGTFQGRKYQINRATFRFLNTVGGYVGPDLDTLDAIDMRTNLHPSLATGTPTPLYTGFDTYTIRPGDAHGHIAYRQTDPMPVTILSILPLVAPGQTP